MKLDTSNFRFSSNYRKTNISALRKVMKEVNKLAGETVMEIRAHDPHIVVKTDFAVYFHPDKPNHFHEVKEELLSWTMERGFFLKKKKKKS